MTTRPEVQEQLQGEDSALEPLGMTVGDSSKPSYRGDQLKLFGDQSEELTESARELVRSHPLQAVGIALLIGILLGR